MLFALDWQIFGRDVDQVGACRRIARIDSGRGVVATGPNDGTGTRERGPEADQPAAKAVLRSEPDRDGPEVNAQVLCILPPEITFADGRSQRRGLLDRGADVGIRYLMPDRPLHS